MSIRVKSVFLFAAVLGFLALTVPANHSEAEDAYYYSLMAEQGAWSEMFHAHHLFYLPLMRIIFRAVQFAGYAGRPLPVLTAVSMISGALAVCLMASLLRRAGAKARTARFFSAALLFSYGFWRYSTTAEIYVPAAALVLLTIYCAVRSEDHPLFFGGSVLSGVSALLMHLVTLPAILLAVPLFYFAKQCRRRAILYFTLTVLIASSVYFSAARTAGLTVFTDKQIVRESLFSSRVWLKGAAASGQNVLSGNFLFAFPSAAKKIESMFPLQMLQEEVFMGQKAPVWVRRMAPVTLGLTAALFAALLFIMVRKIHWTAMIGLALLWLGGTAGMALCFEPANPEMWVSALAPFWLMAGSLWDAAPSGGRLSRRLPAMLAIALLVHNWTGGMSLIKTPESDYCRQKGAWVIEHARHGDLILTADSHSFVTFLEYQTPARVLDAKFRTPENILQTLESRGSGRVFVYSDVINLFPAVASRGPGKVARLQTLAGQLHSKLTPVFDAGNWVVYEWDHPRDK